MKFFLSNICKYEQHSMRNIYANYSLQSWPYLVYADFRVMAGVNYLYEGIMGDYPGVSWNLDRWEMGICCNARYETHEKKTTEDFGDN